MPSTKPQLNVRPAPDVPGLVEELGGKYGMSQSEVVTWAVRRLARSEGFLHDLVEARQTLDHLARADRLAAELEEKAEEVRAAVEGALSSLDPLPEE